MSFRDPDLDTGQRSTHADPRAIAPLCTGLQARARHALWWRSSGRTCSLVLAYSRYRSQPCCGGQHRLTFGGLRHQGASLGCRRAGDPRSASCTLKYKMAERLEMVEAQEKFDAAQRINDGKGRRVSNPASESVSYAGRPIPLRNLARAKVLRRSRVVCCTAAGVDAVPLGDESFDVVILDEATQAPDPVALAAIERGAVMVLAGDPEAAAADRHFARPQPARGLSSTLFERCSERWPCPMRRPC